VSSIRLTVLLCIVVATGAKASSDHPVSVPTHFTATTHDAIPPSITSYATSDVVTRSYANLATASFDASELLTHARHYEEGTSNSAGSPSYLPVLYSALIPGAGEIALGHWVRGSLMVALEVIAWTGYAKYDGDGVDWRTTYEAFADDHWSINDWIEYHPTIYPTPHPGWEPAQMDSIGRVVSGSGTWPGYIPWVSRAEDKQHFYENIGKYDWYISGWEDVAAFVDANPGAVYPQESDLRDQYRDMRIESDASFDTAKRFVYLSVATRVTSVLQTIFLVRRHASNNLEQSRVGVRARAYGLSGGEVALEVRFK